MTPDQANRRTVEQLDGSGEFARDCRSRPGVSRGGRKVAHRNVKPRERSPVALLKFGMKNQSANSKLLPVILALSFLLAGCGRQDADFTKRIPGTWRQEMRAYTNTLTIIPDGTFAY